MYKHMCTIQPTHKHYNRVSNSTRTRNSFVGAFDRQSIELIKLILFIIALIFQVVVYNGHCFVLPIIVFHYITLKETQNLLYESYNFHQKYFLHPISTWNGSKDQDHLSLVRSKLAPKLKVVRTLPEFVSYSIQASKPWWNQHS